MTLPKRLSVVVVTPFGDGGQGGIDRLMDGLRPLFARNDSLLPDVRFIASRGPGHIVWSPLYLLRALALLVWYRSTGRLDIAHVNLSNKGSVLRKVVVCGLLRLLRAPYALHLHGSGFDEYWDRVGHLFDCLIEWQFRHAAVVIVLGTKWADYVGQKLPGLRPPVVTLPNATADPGKNTDIRTNKSCAILFAGRLGARKGAFDLVKALARLSVAHNWTATIAGDGDVEVIRAELIHNGIVNRVRLPGWVSGSDREKLWRQADIFVLPSYAENLPMAIVEAFAYGVAVVCTPVGATPDIVQDNISGLIVEPGDIEGLAQAIGRLLDDAPLRARLGAAGRNIYEERLELNHYARRLAAVWAKAAG